MHKAQGSSFHAGWAPGQLARECKAGVWLTAAASGSFVLQHGRTGEAFWHQALQLMGGDYAQLSKAMQHGYDADVMGLKL